MRRTPISDLPFWPRLLSHEEAARYVGVSVDVFDTEVRAGVWPPAQRRGERGGRLTWDRLALDRAADRASHLESPTEPAPPVPRETQEYWRAQADDAYAKGVGIYAKHDPHAKRAKR